MIKEFIEMNEVRNKAGFRPSIKDLYKKEKKISDLIVMFGKESYEYHGLDYEEYISKEVQIKFQKRYDSKYYELEKEISELCAMCRAFRFKI